MEFDPPSVLSSHQFGPPSVLSSHQFGPPSVWSSISLILHQFDPPSLWSSHQNFFHQMRRTTKNLPSVWPPTKFLPSNEEKVYWRNHLLVIFVRCHLFIKRPWRDTK